MASLALVNDPAPLSLDHVNSALCGLAAEDTVRWARDTFGSSLVMTSSFGAESAVMLHLVKQLVPDIRVIFLDTGYLFAETYAFAQQLTERLGLDVRVYGSKMSTARQEALFGKLWEGSKEDVARYQQINKVEPLERALQELAPRAWLAGIRRSQTSFRSGLQTAEFQQGMFKIHPILEWSDADVAAYLHKHDLPYHPLVAKGYLSIGDEHSTFPVLEGEHPRAGRMLGEQRECGIHLKRDAAPVALQLAP